MISAPPRVSVRAIGAPVTGSVPPALTPPPGVLWLGDGEVAGLSPPGGTVLTLAVGVDGLGEEVGVDGVDAGVDGEVDGDGLGLLLP